jgi:hypothetical protein
MVNFVCDGTDVNSHWQASPFEVDFQKTFWGDHYPRLKGIKDKYDPEQLFIVTQGVGSENWDETLTCQPQV